MPLKTVDELRCSGRVNSSCFTNDTHCVLHVKDPVINHEQGKARFDSYKWNIFVVKLQGHFHFSFGMRAATRRLLRPNCPPTWALGLLSHRLCVIINQDCKTFEVMTSSLPLGTHGSVAFCVLLAATTCQGNPDWKHKLWNIFWNNI